MTAFVTRLLWVVAGMAAANAAGWLLLGAYFTAVNFIVLAIAAGCAAHWRAQ